MKLILISVAFFLFSYLVGTVNPSYLLAKKRGFDIRSSGSGNAGGSNALITMGKGVGAFCILFDIAKAFAVCSLQKHFFPELPLGFPLASLGVILGHIFPVTMHFHGGKGLACLAGSMLSFRPKLFLILLLCEIAVVLIFRYICFVALSGSLCLPAFYGIYTHNIAGTLLLCIVPVVMFYKHRINLQRIRAGVEFQISYLWKKEKEEERIRPE